MSLARINELREQVDEDPSMGAYMALVGEEVSFLVSQKARIEAAVEKRADIEARTAAMKAQVQAMKAEIASRRRGEPTALEAVRTMADLKRHLAEYEALMKDFTERKHTLIHILSYSVADFKCADLSVVSHWLDTWGPFFSGADASCRSLRRRERNTPEAERLLPPTRDLLDVLDDVCRLQLQARSLVGRERYRRSAQSEESVEDFMDNQRQLLEWCDKQRETLSGLSSLADLQEFTASFHANVPVMDSNFLVLAEQCEVLASNALVQKAMKEVNEAWIDLCLTTYEKLREAVTVEHRASNMEATCAIWLRNLIPRVASLMTRAKALLSDTDDAVAALPDAKRVLKRIEKIVKEQDAYRIVGIHLADFGVREECVLPHYEALRNELRSAMTSTVLSFPTTPDYEGGAENRSRVEELREWIDVNSQKGTYVKLLQRLEGTKQMIEEYADALFPEDDAASASAVR